MDHLEPFKDMFTPPTNTGGLSKEAIEAISKSGEYGTWCAEEAARRTGPYAWARGGGE